MKRSLQILLSAALGAFVGTVIALQLNHYFWWVGMLGGGAIGYSTYEIETVVRVLKTTYRRMEGWQPDRAYWAALVQSVKWTATVGFTLAIGAAVFCYIVGVIWGLVVSDYKTALSFSLLFALGCALFFQVGLTLLLSLRFNDDYRKGGRHFRRSMARARRESVAMGPRHVYFNLLPTFVRQVSAEFFRWIMGTLLTQRTVFAIGRGFRWIGLFCWTVFKLINSEPRLLVLLGATIGTAIGYHLRNAWIGAIVGGLLAVVSYQVVSVRWLKTAPAKNRT